MTFALDYSKDDWRSWCAAKKLPAFNHRQIFQWIFQKQIVDPLKFSNLSIALRQMLKEEFSWELPTISSHLISKDGSEKFLLQSTDKQLFEMVLMPYEGRTTLCISSQVGCKMGCTFCQTGKMGFRKNLSSGEILSQLLIANHRLNEIFVKRVSNVVFMGMGEPLDNYDEVLRACQVMLESDGMALAKSKVTISTSGLAPEIERLGKDLPVRLAISLHNADDTKRSAMMPINRKYNLERLKKSLLNYPAPKRYGITFEYVMIEGKNDSLEDAKKLVAFLHGIQAKVNLIPLNHFPGLPLKACTEEKITAFQKYLSSRSIPAPVRYSRGQDISGGCGQLAAKEQGQLDWDPRRVQKARRSPSHS